MIPHQRTTSLSALLLLMLIVPLIAACGGTAEAPVVRETVPPVVQVQTSIVVATPTPGAAAMVTTEPIATSAASTAPAATATGAASESGAFTTPDPMLGDIKVRQALAYCTDRPELIKSVYPFVDADQQKKQLMDSIVPQGHWALGKNLTTYPFDAAKGNALLDEAGWKLPEGGKLGEDIRAKDGTPLFIKFLTTDAQFRQTWAAVLEQQLKNNCGIQISRTHAPASFVFGDSTGLKRRDYQLAAFAWVGEPDPKGDTLYACNQIPLPSNNWEGQNGMGWCNETANKAIKAANNTLDRNERIKQYDIFQKEFTKDMVSLPLFQRLEAEAASNNLVNFKPDPTEYVTANADQWSLKNGDNMVIAFSQEPSSLWSLVTDIAAGVEIAQMTSINGATKYNYDYQAKDLKQLPTLDNGGATNTDVDVKEGDMVWTTTGTTATLKSGLEVVNAAGETVTYSGGPLKMKQLAVTFEYPEGMKWEDGQPIVKADWELATKIDCDKDSGSTSFTVCDSRQKIDFASDNKYTITYLPGVQWPEYFIYSVGAYPSHQVIQSEGEYKGKKLSEVPAKAWQTLPEIAEKPLSSGPYKIVSWDKGQKLELAANENYYKGAPKIKKITIQFVSDTNQAVAQLLTGDADLVTKDTLGAGSEVETVLKAQKEGKIQAQLLASPTWEHIDMNLFDK